MYNIGQLVTAVDPEGRFARGEITSRDRGADGSILYYEIRNLVSGISQIISPDVYSFRLGIHDA